MKLFGKGASGGSRRNTRIFLQRCRTAGLYAAAAGVVIGAAVMLWHSGSLPRIASIAAEKTIKATAAAGFKVDNVVVTGNTRVPRDEIVEAIGAGKGTAVFSLDLAAAREKLVGISWIRAASVGRRLPGTLVVNVEERQPFALWQRNRKVSLIDAEGVELSARRLKDYSDLPLVVGAGAAESTAGLLVLLRAEPAIAAEVASAVRVGNRRWDLHLKNGIVVMLPAKDEGLALAKLARAASEAQLLQKSVSRVDLRQPDRLVLQPGRPVKLEPENI